MSNRKYYFMALVVCCLLSLTKSESCSSCKVGCCDQYYACPVSRSSCYYYTGTAVNTVNDVSATCSPSACSTGCCSTTTSCGTSDQCATCNATACSYGCCSDSYTCGSITYCGVAGQIIAIVVTSTIFVVMILVFLVAAFMPWGRLKGKEARAAKKMRATQMAQFPQNEPSSLYQIGMYDQHSRIDQQSRYDQQSRGSEDRAEFDMGVHRGYAMDAADYRADPYRGDVYRPHNEFRGD